MALNQLPEDYDEANLGPQKRRTEFESEEAKLAYDADNLIALAQKISREKGIAVSPESLITRADDDVNALRRAIAIQLKAKPKAKEVGGELSAANAEFLAAPKRQQEYNACQAVLERKRRAEGMPTFEECIGAMEKKGNKTLDALRSRTQDLRLTIAVIIGDDGKVKSFRPGLIEARANLDFLRDEANPQNYTGQHYDKVYENLSPYGLREPDFDEYSAIFATIKEMENGTLIDKNGWTMLDMGKRTDKNAAVPLAAERNGFPSRSSDWPAYLPGDLVSRPSVWGEDVPPKS